LQLQPLAEAALVGELIDAQNTTPKWHSPLAS
jgi:hypothetical protein